MNKERKIGVIGLGTVGRAVYHALDYYHPYVFGYDKEGKGTFKSMLDTDIVFICVPTSKDEDGRLDMSIVKDVLSRLDESEYEGLAVIKSTASLGFFENIASQYDLRIAYNPEFVTEKRPLQMFVNPDRVVLATENDKDMNYLKDIYYWCSSRVLEMSFKEAEMVKIVSNAKIAIDVSFTNEIDGICREHGIDSYAVMKAVWADHRRTPYWLDPRKGPYDGQCVPKDTREFLNATDSKLATSAHEINEEIKKKLEEGEIEFEQYTKGGEG